MFLVFIAAMLLASVPLAGGDLRKLAGIRIAGRRLVVSALLLQILITQLVHVWPHAVLVALHLASYALIAVALWYNRRLPGLPLLTLGGALNGVVIGLNGGTLPASARALRHAGITTNANFTNSGVLPHPILKPLGDIVATPSWLPFRNVISIGDIVVLLGLALLLHTISGSRLIPHRSTHQSAATASRRTSPNRQTSIQSPPANPMPPAPPNGSQNPPSKAGWPAEHRG